jgi:ABC-type transporter Mla subunit MlaD
MEGRGAFLRVGVLIVAGIVVLGALVWFLGGDRLRHGVPYETYFRESVQGLDVGAPVKYRGVTIGRVTEVGLVSAAYAKNQPVPLAREAYLLVFARFIIDPARIGRLPDNTAAVASGLRTRLASQGLTGITYIELDFVNPRLYPPQTVQWTPKDEYIPSMPSTLLQVQDAAQQFLAKLNGLDVEQTLRSVDGLVQDLRASLRQGDIHQTLARTDTLLDTLNDAVKSADIAGLSGDLRATARQAGDLLRDPDAKLLLARAALAADRLAQASAKLQPLIASLQSTSGRADTSLADVQRAMGPLLRDLQATASNLRETTESLRRYPAQVLLGAPPPRAPAEGGTR